MKLEGIHHITAITGDAPANVEFYTGLLGLRMVKRTVNQDDPTVYHLFYGDEDGSPGMDLTFFEYPGAAPAGRAQAWSTGSSGGWAPGGAGVLAGAPRGRRGAEPARRRRAALRRPRGARARARSSSDAPDAAAARRVAGDPRRARPARLRGRPRLRRRPGPQRRPARAGARLRRASAEGSWMVRGERAAQHLGLRRAALRDRSLQGAGSVHHIAFACEMAEHEAVAERAIEAGAAPDARDRPLLLPLRSTSASRAACCSRSPRSAPASPSTRTRPNSVSGSRCRPLRAAARAARGHPHAAARIRRRGATGRPHLSVLRLVTIPISHYCEKARWALDRAGLGYREERHVQGIHQLAARRAGGGRTVPVLVTPEESIGESAQILEWVGRAHGSRPAAVRRAPARAAQEVGRCAHRFDELLGPAGPAPGVRPHVRPARS